MGRREIESISIVIDEEFPDTSGVVNGCKYHKVLMGKEGVQLADTLCSVLPQGIVDVLLIELLKRKRSMLVGVGN